MDGELDKTVKEDEDDEDEDDEDKDEDEEEDKARFSGARTKGKEPRAHEGII